MPSHGGGVGAFNACVAARQELCHWWQGFPLALPPVFAGAWQEAASFAWDLCLLSSSAHTIADQGRVQQPAALSHSLNACPAHHAHLLVPPSPASLLLFCKGPGTGRLPGIFCCLAAGLVALLGRGRLCSKAGNRTASVWSLCFERGPLFLTPPPFPFYEKLASFN